MTDSDFLLELRSRLESSRAHLVGCETALEQACEEYRYWKDVVQSYKLIIKHIEKHTTLEAMFTEDANGTEPSRAGTHATVALGNEGADTKGEKGKQ